jgi:hypothetical protein
MEPLVGQHSIGYQTVHKHRKTGEVRGDAHKDNQPTMNGVVIFVLLESIFLINGRFGFYREGHLPWTYLQHLDRSALFASSRHIQGYKSDHKSRCY